VRGSTDPVHERVLELWGRTLRAVESRRPRLVDTEIDWVIKYRLLDDYADPQRTPLEHPRLAQLDLAYHDIDRSAGAVLPAPAARPGRPGRQRPGGLPAKVNPPPTTRAKLRGDFIRAAQANRRDFTVDWVHLKLNDQAQRTVLCKDPFLAQDARVERLIEGMTA
jgi:proteasome accessory factor A